MNQNMQLKMTELERSNSTVGIFLDDKNWYFCISDWIERPKCFEVITTLYVGMCLIAFFYLFFSYIEVVGKVEVHSDKQF